MSGNSKGECSEKSQKTYMLIGVEKRPYKSEIPGAFGGHSKSKIYGRMDCRAAIGAIDKGGYIKYRVFFADEATAIAAGFRPCAVCLPEKYATWKSQKEM